MAFWPLDDFLAILTHKITAVAMKKFLAIFLGVVGVGVVGYSVTQGWASWTQSTQFGMGFAIDPTLGYEYWQGIAAAVMALIAFGLLFVKPKIAILPALLASGLSLWLYLIPPTTEGTALVPQKAILYAVAGGVVLVLAGLLMPKKK